MKKYFLLLFVILIATVSTMAQDYKRVAMVNTYADETTLLNSGDDDEIAAWQWLKAKGGSYLAASNCTAENLAKYTCLWLAIDRETGEDAATLTSFLKTQGLTDNVIAAIKKYYQDGRNLLLTNHACMAMTWFGRAKVYPQNYGSSAGKFTSGVWYALLTYGKDPNVNYTLVHQENDQLYNNIEKKATASTDRDDTWTIALISGDYKEDHNCFWHFDTSDFPVTKTNGETCTNGDYEKISLVKDVYGVDMLATWSHINDFYGGAITRWNPIAPDPYGKEIYKGTAIAIGIAAYEWNVKNGSNEYQSNIEQLTANALKELTSTAPNYETVTLSSTGVSSFSSVYPLTFSENDDLKAYVASSAAEGKVYLTQVTGDVPANTGLILKGTADTDYNITIASSASDLNENNLLVATIEATEVAASAENSYNYLFGTLDGVQAFYKLEMAMTSNPFKAYLHTTTDYTPNASGHAKLDMVFDETTGINNAEKAELHNASNAIFNIAGQKVSSAYKGIVIKNGKKYIVK